VNVIVSSLKIISDSLSTHYQRLTCLCRAVLSFQVTDSRNNPYQFSSNLKICYFDLAYDSCLSCHRSDLRPLVSEMNFITPRLWTYPPIIKWESRLTFRRRDLFTVH